ncbi:MAG: hypothetical protein C6P37_06490 [Caldibacillus debilis]|uniref:Uncharacterized protein n=1 Tax=Caldibacillus debilis TaxID=301148 RepID=A0A150LIP8_9BACI|nr:hypothetical protein B4135_3112 [Caldibacillus debilis]MBO2481993.1 hypothetical protein [Bacillaceae bacterium]MBY6270810.1 hypothetical protein [Bacillaceae bacterium]OUM91426.1 MAG: hypothetical protein BAA03_11110 [Caldibacillus debilis]REJ16861.1 MAG: hypothetical protein C6W57_07880 [Caldibacillus debilis]
MENGCPHAEVSAENRWEAPLAAGPDVSRGRETPAACGSALFIASPISACGNHSAFLPSIRDW